MPAYNVALFLHIIGVLGLFAGVALEQAGLIGLRRATAISQAREWTSLFGVLRRVEAPAALLVVATGGYMVARGAGAHAWAGLGLPGMVLMAALGIAVTRRRVAAVAAALPAGDGPVPPHLRERLREPALRASASLRVALGLGIVFIMSVKPEAAGALVALGIALVFGAAAALGGTAGRDTVPAGD